MSLKAEIEIWVKALENFDARDYTQSLAHFAKIADSSRILFNVGLIHANMGQHQTAIVYYDQAQRLDQYFALSFFQCGVSFFLIGNYEAAAQHFQDAYIHLRENAAIDYEQIGLKFKLYSAEVLFNQGLSYLRMNQTDQGMRLLDQAWKEKEIPEHDIVDEALAAFGRDFTVFSVPTGMLFRPSDLKVKNLQAKNYLGKAKLVAATSPVDAFVGFSGVGAKPATSSESSSPTTSACRKRQSPPIHSRSKSTPIPVPSVPRMEGSDIPPLRLTKKKSSVDLRGGASPPFSVRPLAPSDPNMKLPRINTDVYKPSHPYAQYTSAIASQSPPQSLKTLPSIASPMPPTPPDSDSGRKNLLVDRRDTATTRLGHLADPYPQKRDTNFMDDLVSEYSTVSVEPFPRRPSLPSPNRQPQPQGQPADRVTTWAHNQRGTGNSQAPGRYARPSAPPSMQPSMGTLRRLGSRRFDDMQRLRSGSLDDHLSPTLASNQTLDDLLAARAGEMLSFRLKLHFQDDIRGMSLDADTPWPEFYARLQSKFGVPSMSLKYKDEDGTFVTIADEDDWDSAIDAARENCRSGRLDGKLDIWIVEGSPTRRIMS